METNKVQKRKNKSTSKILNDNKNNVNYKIEKAKATPELSVVKYSYFYQLFGFKVEDLLQWKSFVKLLHRPSDPSSLGMLRCVFGLLMLMDIFHERGLHLVDYIFGDPEECRFPLFNFLKPLPLVWMYMVYFIMILGAVGIMLGFMFKASALIFIISYWYIFLLDKSTWNNHSYLYGLSAILLFVSDANRYWSIDGLIWPKISNANVPLWNYALFRIQFFLVYFIAGLKKLDMDWVDGYSMNSLSSHWVFSPFRNVLSNEDIDLWVVHRGGLTLDLTVGYLLFFDFTRPLGFLLGGSFHFMNSQMFAIGMFPYTMLATMPIFCHVDWPKKCPVFLRLFFNKEKPQMSSHCYYEEASTDINKTNSKKKQNTAKRTSNNKHEEVEVWKHLKSVLFLLYVTSQCCLPYSHFITKGYNTWTNGLYGYSWDMMVHSWSTQHVRITYVDKDTNQIGYIQPEAWTRGSDRWSSHADMIKQYAVCLKERLATHDIHNVALYFDIWRSLNDRFQQRLIDPRVDIVTAPWSAFESTEWIMPLLTELSDWRGKLDEIEKDIYNSTNMTEVVFIADVPDLSLENFIQKDFGNSTLHILKGKVIVEMLETKQNVSLLEGEKIQIAPETFHKIYTLSESNSCLMYMYTNTTEKYLHQKFLDAESNDGGDLTDEERKIYQDIQTEKNNLLQKINQGWIESFTKFVFLKAKHVQRGLTMLRVALQSVLTMESFEVVFNQTVIN